MRPVDHGIPMLHYSRYLIGTLVGLLYDVAEIYSHIRVIVLKERLIAGCSIVLLIRQRFSANNTRQIALLSSCAKIFPETLASC